MNRRTAAAFTLIELMVVVAVIAILASLAVPSLRDRLVRDQIVEAMKIAEVAKAPVAEKIVGTYVTAVSVEGGAIHVRFGNKAQSAIAGRTLSLRPAVVEDAAVVPVAWVCGRASAVPQMVAKGVDRTDVEARFLPLNCRPGA